ncbi:MAG TPA: SDR family oxidoreductase [Chitinophagaceae bacterium]|nr:SDR family oxidoreductase [Chitinophagaceae bacterium]
MRILIFGASGATGHELVKQALTSDHLITAFVRDPSKLNLKNKNLEIVQGDVKDYASVENAIKGHDAVLSALGVSKPLKNDPVVIEGVKNILLAMEKLNIMRFVYLSFLAVGQGRNDAGFLIKHVISRIVHNEIEDHQEKEALIKASNREWTIIHPPKLTNGVKKGVYRIGEDLKSTSFFPTLSRADLADFMIKQLNDNRFLRKTVRIMN